MKVLCNLGWPTTLVKSLLILSGLSAFVSSTPCNALDQYPTPSSPNSGANVIVPNAVTPYSTEPTVQPHDALVEQERARKQNMRQTKGTAEHSPLFEHDTTRKESKTYPVQRSAGSDTH